MTYFPSNIIQQLQEGQYKTLARVISLVENKVEGYFNFLQYLPINNTPVIGITGPPGAGKSTLTDALIEQLVLANKRLAIVCVDPSSPFNLGALLGDRIRMSNWYNHPQVYIRSLASRGSLGGLHPSIIEVTDVLKAASFDYILVETVGVGQSEIEIAGLANVTIVVMVPEAGDHIQTMKAGLMEIADVFVVNKADRPDAEKFVKNLQQMLAPSFTNKQYSVPILTTVASEKKGIIALQNTIETQLQQPFQQQKKLQLLTEKCYQLIQQHKMMGIKKEDILQAITKNILREEVFNLYQFTKQYL